MNVITKELRLKSRQNVALNQRIKSLKPTMKFARSAHLSCIYASWKQEKRETEKKQYNHKMMNGHTSKIARMLRRDVDVDQHILNISSNQLTFKRACTVPRPRFATSQRQISPMEVWSQLVKGLLATWTSAILWSIALNYIERKGPKPPKALVRSINHISANFFSVKCVR